MLAFEWPLEIQVNYKIHHEDATKEKGGGGNAKKMNKWNSSDTLNKIRHLDRNYITFTILSVDSVSVKNSFFVNSIAHSAFKECNNTIIGDYWL